MPASKKRGLVRMPSRRRPKPEEEEFEIEEGEEELEIEAVIVAEEEEEAEPPKKRPRRRAAAPEEEEEEVEEEEEAEEEAEPPKKRPRRRAAPPEEEEAEAPKRRNPRANKSESTALEPARKPTFGGIEGDMDSDDFEMPSFKLLHQMSPDFEETPAYVGKFVYNKEVSLGTSVDVVLIRFRKKFKEVCDYDENALPEEFDSKAEAIAAGVKVRPCAVVDLLIPCTDETAPEALVTIGDEEFLMCRWYISGGGYRKVAGPLMSHMSKGTDNNISERYYALNVVALPGKGKRKVAVLKPTSEETAAAVRAKIADIQTNPVE